MNEAPDYAEALLAWRAWRVVRSAEELSLMSIVQRTIWPVGRMLSATCLYRSTLVDRLRRRPRHEAPAYRCECGIYGTTLDQTGTYVEPPVTGVGRVLGLVALWGTVVECERGYRASYAYPSRIFVPVDAASDPRFDAGTIADGLERYGVPVETVPAACRHAASILGHTAAAP